MKSWTVNGVETPAGDPADTDDQTFTAVAAGSVDVEVTVVFEEIPTYEITYSVHEVEPGRPNGALTVEAERKGMEIYKRETVRSGDRIHEGSIVTFTAEPKTGYRVKAWTYDGTVLKGRRCRGRKCAQLHFPHPEAAGPRPSPQNHSGVCPEWIQSDIQRVERSALCPAWQQ